MASKSDRAGERSEEGSSGERRDEKRRGTQPGREGELSDETYGPLAVERHSKDDGRSLILYTHDRRHQT